MDHANSGGINSEGALREGTLLHDYIIAEVLGRGGFGITYKGWHAKLKVPVAIKEYMPASFSFRGKANTVIPLAESQAADSFKYGLNRFLDEAKDLIKFSHPNIVGAINYFEENGTAYIVMDYAEGQTLTEWLKYMDNTNQRPSEDDLRFIFLQILDGLKEVHEKNLLHRDIKADNIYVQNDGPPMLIDFGSARNDFGSKSRSLNVIVSPGYSPKEQYAQEGKQGPWTDIYAVGASMWYAICREVPLESTLRADHRDHGESDKHGYACQKFKGQYSDNFLRTIDWCLSLNAPDRPQDVDKVRDCLYEDRQAPTPELPSNAHVSGTADSEALLSGDRQNPIVPAWSMTTDAKEVTSDSLNTIKSSKNPRPTFTRLLLIAGCLAGLGVLGLLVMKLVPRPEIVSPDTVSTSKSNTETSENRQLIDEIREQIDSNNSDLVRYQTVMTEQQEIDLNEEIAQVQQAIDSGDVNRAHELLRSIKEKQIEYLNKNSRYFETGSSPEEIQSALESCELYLGEVDKNTQLPNCPRALFEIEKGSRVELPPYSMDEAEISFAEFAEFVEREGYVTTAEKLNWSIIELPSNNEIVKLKGYSWRTPLGEDNASYEAFGELPVVHVTFSDAKEYCVSYGKRVPSRAEWEHAFGASSTRYHAEYFDPEDHAKFDGEISFDGLSAVTEKSIFDSTTKLYGGTGNVREWTETPNPASPQSRFTKGGSWLSAAPAFMRVSSLRSEFKEDSFIDLGFRCVTDLKEWPR